MLIKNAKIYGEKVQDLRLKDGKIVEIGENLKPNLSENSKLNLGKKSSTNSSEMFQIQAHNSNKNSHENNANSSQNPSEISQNLAKKQLAKNSNSSQNSAENEIFYAQNLTLIPSFIDFGVSLKNDHFSIENLQNLEQECLESGVCAVVLKDRMDFSEEAFALFLEHLKALRVQIYALVRVLDGSGKLKNLSTLVNKGAFGFELQSNARAGALRQAMQYAQMKAVPIFVHCYEDGYDDNGVMNDSELSFKLGLVGISEVSEFSEVAKMGQVAKFYGAKVLYECISLEKSLQMLGNTDFIQTSIHHILKTQSECDDFNTFAKIMPPLRDKKDTHALKAALKAGKIAFLTSLHSPKSITHKDLSFDEASFGIDAMGEFVALCASFLVKNGEFSWREVAKFTSENQAKFLGLNSGEIALGKAANFILLDENAKFSPQENSLYAKDSLNGVIRAHFIKGERVK